MTLTKLYKSIYESKIDIIKNDIDLVNDKKIQYLLNTNILELDLEETQNYIYLAHTLQTNIFHDIILPNYKNYDSKQIATKYSEAIISYGATSLLDFIDMYGKNSIQQKLELKNG